MVFLFHQLAEFLPLDDRQTGTSVVFMLFTNEGNTAVEQQLNGGAVELCSWIGYGAKLNNGDALRPRQILGVFIALEVHAPITKQQTVSVEALVHKVTQLRQKRLPGVKTNHFPQGGNQIGVLDVNTRSLVSTSARVLVIPSSRACDPCVSKAQKCADKF